MMQFIVHDFIEIRSLVYDCFEIYTIVSQPSKCLKFMTFREGCFVIRNLMQVLRDGPLFLSGGGGVLPFS